MRRINKETPAPPETGAAVPPVVRETHTTTTVRPAEPAAAPEAQRTRFHIQPINVVVFHGSQGRTCFEASFPLRCFQRLSLQHLATLHCGWRHNRSTRGVSIPVLSY